MILSMLFITEFYKFELVSNLFLSFFNALVSILLTYEREMSNSLATSFAS